MQRPSARPIVDGAGVASKLSSSVAAGSRRRLVGYDVVGPNPTRGSGGKPGLGARRKVARGLELAARERGLGRREIRLGDIPLLTVGHGELTVAVGHLRLAGDRHAQQRGGPIV